MIVTAERAGVVTLQGKPITLLGPEIRVGDMAPDFKVVNSEFRVTSLSGFHNVPRLVSSVFSLETGVCSDQTKRIDEALPRLSRGAVAMLISMDTPFAQTRFRESAAIVNTQLLSDIAWQDFGTKYGLLIKDMGLLARSVWVISREGKVLYKEIVPEIATHPDYEAALAALRKA
jgi:thiol peroxidase